MLSNLYIAILIALSLADTILTYNWALACIKWKPTLKWNQVESNKFIIVCWNNMGLFMGSLISGIVLLIVQFLLASIHINIYYIMIAILIFANYNHISNFITLNRKLKK